MSMPVAARAMSKVSVPEHMANKNRTSADVVAHGVRNGPFHVGYFAETQFAGHFFQVADLSLVPGGVTEGRPEFPVLPRKIFMVQVEPVIILQVSPARTSRFVDGGVGDFSILQRQCDSIVPRKGMIRCINSD